MWPWGKGLKAVSKARSTNHKAKLLAEVRKIEKELKSSYENELAINELKAVLAISKNSKYFYSYAKKFSKIKSTIGPILDSAKNLVSCPLKMAELLKTQYDSVFSTPLEPMIPLEEIFDVEDINEGPILSDISFEPADIESAIDELSSSSSADPNQFPAILLKQYSRELSRPLHLIWRKSLSA